MSLSNDQFAFVKDMVTFKRWCIAKGWKITQGEAQRPIEMQEIYVATGHSKTMKSSHLWKMAEDLNFFKPNGDGTYTYTCRKGDLQEVGDFWEGLDEKNEWGGNWDSFKDVPHFQRNR